MVAASSSEVVHRSGMPEFVVAAKLKAGVATAEVVKYDERFRNALASHPGVTAGVWFCLEPETMEALRRSRRVLRTAAVWSASNRVEQP
jgi:hypothetical protein